MGMISVPSSWGCYRGSVGFPRGRTWNHTWYFATVSIVIVYKMNFMKPPRLIFTMLAKDSGLPPTRVLWPHPVELSSGHVTFSGCWSAGEMDTCHFQAELTSLTLFPPWLWNWQRSKGRLFHLPDPRVKRTWREATGEHAMWGRN